MTENINRIYQAKVNPTRQHGRGVFLALCGWQGLDVCLRPWPGMSESLGRVRGLRLQTLELSHLVGLPVLPANVIRGPTCIMYPLCFLFTLMYQLWFQFTISMSYKHKRFRICLLNFDLTFILICSHCDFHMFILNCSCIIIFCLIISNLFHRCLNFYVCI